MKLKKFLAAVLTSAMVFSMSASTAFATETAATVAPTEAAATVAPTQAADPYSGVGSYMAFFHVQTTTWVYRNNFTTKEYANENFNTVFDNETSTATTTEIHDTVVDGDGEYTISLNNIDLVGSTDFNMVAISTNIPLDAGISISDAVLKYDDRTISSNGIQKNDNKDFLHIMMINQYDNAMKDTVNTMVPADGANMIITFKVSGFGYEKKVEEEVATVTAAATVAPTTAVEATVEDASATEEDSKGGLSTGAIIGIIAGIVVVITVIGFVINSKKKKGK